MTDHITTLVRELRPADADHTDEVFPAPERAELLEQILHPSHADEALAPPPPGSMRQRINWKSVRTATRLRGSSRRRLLLPTLGTGVAAVVGAIVLFTGSAVVRTPSAVAFTTAANGDITATVTDPYAAQKQLDAAFAAHGFDITVRLVPVSPSLVGTVIALSLSDNPNGQIQSLQGGTCIAGSGGCPIGVEIPATFTGKGSIVLGRPGQPGEDYAASDSAFAPGEALHCTGLLGAQISTALPALASDGLTVTQWRQDPLPNSSSTAVITTPPPSSNYVWNAYPEAPGQLQIDTEPTPLSSDPGLVTYDQQLNQGC